MKSSIVCAVSILGYFLFIRFLFIRFQMSMSKYHVLEVKDKFLIVYDFCDSIARLNEFLLTMPPRIPISSLLIFPNQPPSQQSPTIRRNVYTSSKTTLSVLYTYEDVNAWVEYPETSPDRPVGYLFRRDPHNWENPVRNFAYSLGKPSGQMERGQEREHPLLVDQHGNKVPCVVNHLTCMRFH